MWTEPNLFLTIPPVAEERQGMSGRRSGRRVETQLRYMREEEVEIRRENRQGVDVDEFKRRGVFLKADEDGRGKFWAARKKHKRSREGKHGL